MDRTLGTRPECLDDPDRLMSDRHGARDARSDHVKIRVAHTGGGDADEGLLAPWGGQRDVTHMH
jgi:hypothetical protein